MRKRFLIGGIIGFGLLAGGIGAAAGAGTTAALHAAMQPCGGLLARLHQLHHGRMQQLHQEINLTPEQREALHRILLAHGPEIADALRPVVDAHRVLHDAVMAEQPDNAAIRRASDNLGKAIGDAAVTFASLKGELIAGANITPEQLRKAQAMRSEFQTAVDELLNTLKSSAAPKPAP